MTNSDDLIFGKPNHGGISNINKQLEEYTVIELINFITQPDNGGIIPHKVDYIEITP